MTFEETLRRRLDSARQAPAYSNYLRARGAVLRMLDVAELGFERPSEYWTEELANIDYMLDASPLVICRLRHHCYQVTGIWPYHYRTHRDVARDQHRAKLDALFELGGSDLFVPESPELGGFGFAFEEGLVNIDTLKFFEALLALERGEVLGGFRDASERGVVWEIGAGWGGFAYQFKSLFPNVTYVITDLPQLFLYSATYLATLFPDAKIHFHTGEHSLFDSNEWLHHDFVFVPNTALEAIAPPRVDLAVNMVSFQEMTTEQVERYVEHAHELGTPFLYSLNRERSTYNPTLRGVSAIVREHYWPHEITLLSVSYQQMLPASRGPNGKRDKAMAGKKAKDKARYAQPDQAPQADEDNRYRHLIGWRRMTV
jgi:hypothetical protein